MPVHLGTGSRREFVSTLGAALLTLPAINVFGASRDVDEALVVLLNDTHIGETHKPATPIRRNLRSTVEAILGFVRRPAAIFINGDLALRNGQPGDYRLFAELITPLRESGIPIHLTLGNHDDREVFFEVMSERKSVAPPVVGRHVSVVQTRHANFILCDSLRRTM